MSDKQGEAGAMGVWANQKFINRSPDDASVKNKMIFASSKEAIRRRLDGALLKTTVYMTALMTFQPFIILSFKHQHYP